MQRKLYRSERNRVFFGVCGGIGEYLNVDPVLIRLLFVLMAMAGAGVVFYILAIFIIPEKNERTDYGDGNNFSDVMDYGDRSGEGTDNDRSGYLGIFLVFLGIYFLLERYYPMFSIANWWPVVLIVLGAVIIAKEKRNG